MTHRKLSAVLGPLTVVVAVFGLVEARVTVDQNGTVTEPGQPQIQPVVVVDGDGGVPETMNDIREEMEQAQRKMEERIKLLEVQLEDHLNSTNEYSIVELPRGKAQWAQRIRRDLALGSTPAPYSGQSSSWYPAAQCLMCPTGPAGARGPPGPAGLAGRDGRDGRDASLSQSGSSSAGGSVYVRWGKASCAYTASLVYQGVIGGGHYAQTGGGTNLLCMVQDPSYYSPRSGTSSYRAFIYGSEYEYGSTDYHYASRDDHSPPCAVCLANRKSNVLMVPGKTTCPTGWTREYYGHIMSEMYSAAHPSEFICVDRYPDVIQNTGSGSQDGSRLWLTEGKCVTNGGLPCGPYIDGYEITCAVCSK